MDGDQRKETPIVTPEVVTEESGPQLPPGDAAQPEYSRGTLIAAFSVAIASDIIAAPLGFFPFLLPFEIALDIMTAAALAIIFKGIDLLLILTLILELPPYVSSLPWWTVIVYAKYKGVRVEGLFKLLSSKLPAKKL